MTLTERLDAYEKLIRLDKPIGILLLLWPALWGLWFAKRGLPEPALLLIFVLGVILMRSAGCAINDFADRNLDPHVERTKNRPLAAKRIRPWEALAVAGALSLISFSLVLQLTRLTVILSFVALALAVIYPFLKRVFWLPQAWLGVAFGFSIPMAYAALYDQVLPVAWVLMLANMFWAIAYDTEYAMVDRDDDARMGVKSSALLLGRGDVAGVMACHGVFLAMMAVIGWWQKLGAIYYTALAAAGALMAYQYRLIRGRDRDGCFRAFLNNNYVGMVIFAGLAIDLYFRSRLSVTVIRELR